MKIQAKFKCISVKDYEGGNQESEFAAATGPGNESWSKFTPMGNLRIGITNPAAQGQFVPGSFYMLLISEANDV